RGLVQPGRPTTGRPQLDRGRRRRLPAVDQGSGRLGRLLRGGAGNPGRDLLALPRGAPDRWLVTLMRHPLPGRSRIRHLIVPGLAGGMDTGLASTPPATRPYESLLPTAAVAAS